MTIEIQQDAPLKNRNTLGLDVRAERLVVAHSETDIIEALVVAADRSWPVTVLGGGSNVVVRADIPGLVVLVAVPGILFDGTTVEAGAGENWHHLVLCCLAQGLSGLENLSLIPGSVGAAPIQNIGAYGVELCEVFESLIAVDRESGETVKLTGTDCEFGYRDSIFKQRARDRYIITRVRLALSDAFTPRLGYRELADAVSDVEELTPRVISETVTRIRQSKLPDPDRVGNVGSFFKNPMVEQETLSKLLTEYPEMPNWPRHDGAGGKLSAGWLIEQCGLKGFGIGGAAVSDTHALVIINAGEASGDDVIALADHIKREVERRFDLQLEVEPVLV